jgi:hypothetical protein
VSWEKSSATLWQKSGCIATHRTGNLEGKKWKWRRKCFTSTSWVSHSNFTKAKSSPLSTGRRF